MHFIYTRSSAPLQNVYEKQLRKNKNNFSLYLGQLGTAVMSYFKFIRWLMFLNLYASVIVIGLTLLPYVLLHDGPNNHGNVSQLHQEAFECTQEYQHYVHNSTKTDVFSRILDVLQGTVCFDFFPLQQTTGIILYIICSKFKIPLIWHTYPRS